MQVPKQAEGGSNGTAGGGGGTARGTGGTGGVTGTGTGTGGGGGPPPAQRCPRCDSANTKFCYYNNYSLLQPRYFCKACRRYWTKGGALRNVPVGGGCRKNKRTTPTSSGPGPINNSLISPNTVSAGNLGINHRSAQQLLQHLSSNEHNHRSSSSLMPPAGSSFDHILPGGVGVGHMYPTQSSSTSMLNSPNSIHSPQGPATAGASALSLMQPNNLLMPPGLLNYNFNHFPPPPPPPPPAPPNSHSGVSDLADQLNLRHMTPPHFLYPLPPPGGGGAGSAGHFSLPPAALNMNLHPGGTPPPPNLFHNAAAPPDPSAQQQHLGFNHSGAAHPENYEHLDLTDTTTTTTTTSTNTNAATRPNGGFKGFSLAAFDPSAAVGTLNFGNVGGLQQLMMRPKSEGEVGNNNGGDNASITYWPHHENAGTHHQWHDHMNHPASSGYNHNSNHSSNHPPSSSDHNHPPFL